MEFEYIYILSCQRGQKSPEIYSIWNNYNQAVIAYYNYHVESHTNFIKQDTDPLFDFMYLYKLPINIYFSNNDESSDVKLQKSCKYRIIFKNWGQLKNAYLSENRDSILNKLI